MTPDADLSPGEVRRRIERVEADQSEQRGRNHGLQSDIQALLIEQAKQGGALVETREDIRDVRRDLEGFKKAVIGTALGMLVNLILTLIVLVLR